MRRIRIPLSKIWSAVFFVFKILNDEVEWAEILFRMQFHVTPVRLRDVPQSLTLLTVQVLRIEKWLADAVEAEIIQGPEELWISWIKTK